MLTTPELPPRSANGASRPTLAADSATQPSDCVASTCAARSSRMMFSSASMISALSTFPFLKLIRRLKVLVGGSERKDERPRAPRLRLGGLLPDLLARDRALRRQLLDQRQHLLRVRLPDDLQQRRLRGNVGQPTKVPDLLRHVVQRQRLGDRRPRLPELPRHVLVRVAALLRELLQRLRLFERRQVLALEVLDQRQLHHLDVVGLAHDDRHLAQPDLHRRVVAALAGDDLVAAAALPDDERLDDRPSRRPTPSAPTGRP